MFRHFWIIFREKLSAVVTLGCTIQLSENVLLTVYCAAFGGVTFDEETLCAFVGD
jgi:hypothetical protein